MSRLPTLHTTCLAIVCSLVIVVGAPAAALGAWPSGVQKIAVPTSRVIGPDSFGTAAAVAERAYPEWAGVTHVVIASGVPAAMSDAAVASSLCWAYDAPLLLVTKNSVPSATRAALEAIVSANPSATVHVVGASSTIAAACVAQLQSAVGVGSAVEQPWKTATRYSLAANVASRVRTVAALTGRSVPAVALVANGSNPNLLWDAAAASTVSRHTGIPLLLTSTAYVPGSTADAIASAGNPRVVIVGGTAAVSSAFFTKLHARERWSGATRFDTAVSVASHAVSSGYSEPATFGVSSTASNAVIGAQLVGADGGVLLITGKDCVDRSTWSFLAARAASLKSAYAFGGASISSAQIAELKGAAAKPWFEDGAPGHYVGKKFRVTGRAGGNTTTVALYVRGKRVRTATVKPWGRFNFTAVGMPVSSTRVYAVAENPDGPSATAGRLVRRLKYPSATCIVIDKSQFKLYWVKNNRLVKAYPIATGRASMETPAPTTWKILAKYHTSPGSVYGPRKMRLFRQRGSHYVFSAYGIHGTNQEWVIGTKASHGCIRMYNRDVLQLFPQIPLGTMVYIRP